MIYWYITDNELNVLSFRVLLKVEECGDRSMRMKDRSPFYTILERSKLNTQHTSLLKYQMYDWGKKLSLIYKSTMEISILWLDGGIAVVWQNKKTIKCWNVFRLLWCAVSLNVEKYLLINSAETWRSQCWSSWLQWKTFRAQAVAWAK